MSEQSQRITELSPEKRELLLRRLRKESDGPKHQVARPSTRQIMRAGRATNSFPPSFAQQRLWFLNQLQPDSPFYNVPDNFRLKGPLDVAALERSFGEIVRRHEVLRTTFDLVAGEPRQFVNDATPFVMPLTDLTGLPGDRRDAEVFRLAEEEAKRIFDLKRDLMLRARLLRLGEEEHVLLLTMHHVASDGWSRSVLTSELTTLYAAFSEGRAPELAELPVQYADFAAWQRAYLTGDVLEEQLGYWRERLGGDLPALELHTDRRRPPIPTQRGAYHEFAFPRKLAEGLRALSRESGATLFMTLLAAFKTLLYRYTGQTDIIVGTPVAGRSRAELEPLIGFFVNMLVLRTDLSGDPSFRRLLQRVKQAAFGAYAHQDVPFEKLVEELHPRRDMSRNPLFQVAFALQNAPAEEFSLRGLSMSPLDVGSGSSRFDIECHLWETPDGLGGGLIYSTDLFEEATVARMLAHYEQLLEGIVAAPDAALSDLPLLTATERRQLLVEWRGNREPYPRHVCLHQLFEAQAAQTPERVALIFGEERITYEELNRRANSQAARLRAAGVGREVLVGILAERSVEMLVALLAVLKAGGAYVPLDPQYPQERLAFMINDTAMPVLMTQKRLTARLPSHSARVVLLDDERELEEAGAHHPASDATPDNAAYVIYTSGSTGRPKGVVIEHRSVVAFLTWATKRFSADDLAGTLASTSICFDLSIFELFAPLVCGGSVVLAENVLTLPQLPAAREVTLVNTVPSAMAELIRSDGLPESVRTVNLAGEALKGSLVREVYRHEHVRKVFNLYGPSEDTTYSTESLVERGEELEPTIGRPVTNGEVYLLDACRQLVPVGVVGELYIGGAGLARGYLNRPELTAERFVPHPFGDAPGARLYRTGDLGRFQPDGRIEFLGRADDQLKIRGFRIEPGEIEAALASHARVREAAVLAREDAPDDKRLIAYVVEQPCDALRRGDTPQSGAATRADVPLAPDELRGFLRERLPEHLVPTGFVMLDALPLNANGKLDRRALQLLSQPEVVRPGRFVAPRDALELRLVRIWEDVLRVPRVGIHDNFFDLGGHSLLAVRLLAQLRQQLKRDLPLAALLQAQTIEDLARLLRQQNGAVVSPTLVPIQPHGFKPPFFCIHPVSGNVLCYLDLARQMDPERPFYGLQAPGLEADSAAPSNVPARVEELAAFYLEAMREAQPEGPYLLGGWSMGGVVAFEMARQLRLRGERAALVALLDSHAPLAADISSQLDEETLRGMFADDLKRLGGLEPALQCEEPHFATDALLAGMEDGQLRRSFNAFKSNVQALARYIPRTYPGRITLFRASEQLDGAPADPLNGWQMLAADVESHSVPGNHYTMIRQPHVRVLAELLNSCLEAALVERAAQKRAPG